MTMKRRQERHLVWGLLLVFLLGGVLVRGDGLFGGSQPNLSLYVACGSAVFLTATVAYFMFCRRSKKVTPSTSPKSNEVGLEAALVKQPTDPDSPREDGEGPRRRPPPSANKQEVPTTATTPAAVVVVDKTKCGKCSLSLSGGTTLSSNNMRFHKECFTCNSCNQKLEFGRIVNQNSKLHCERCANSPGGLQKTASSGNIFAKPSLTRQPSTSTSSSSPSSSSTSSSSTFAPPKLTVLPSTTITTTTTTSPSTLSAPSPTTTRTPAIITTPVTTTTLSSPPSSNSEVISPRVESAGKGCGKCGQPVGNTAIQALDQEFHEECWTCSVCEKPIDGRFVKQGGKPVCETCARNAQKSGSRIGGSGSQIGGGGSRIGSQIGGSGSLLGGGGGSQIGSSGSRIGDNDGRGSQIGGSGSRISGGSQISGSRIGNSQAGQMGLLQWCKNRTEGYEGVEVTNFTKSWADGLAFCALVHSYGPELIDYNSLPKGDALEDKALALKNCQLAFEAAEKLGVTPLLDAEDVVYATPYPEKLSMMTYLSSLYKGLAKSTPS